MDHNAYMKLVAQTVREAGIPDQEHIRLWSDLRNWATQKGCSIKMGFDKHSFKDVLHRTEFPWYFFVCDAKGMERETVDNGTTLRYIVDYLKDFGHHLKDHSYTHGDFVIVTNDQNEAYRWIEMLKIFAYISEIRGAGGNPLSFRVDDISVGETWIVHPEGKAEHAA